MIEKTCYFFLVSFYLCNILDSWIFLIPSNNIKRMETLIDLLIFKWISVLLWLFVEAKYFYLFPVIFSCFSMFTSILPSLSYVISWIPAFSRVFPRFSFVVSHCLCRSMFFPSTVLRTQQTRHLKINASFHADLCREISFIPWAANWSCHSRSGLKFSPQIAS